MAENTTGKEHIPESGIGSIRLNLERTMYLPCEVVEGTLVLRIHRPVRARGLFAVLSAQQQFHRPGGNVGENGRRIVLRRVYHYQQQLDGERKYQPSMEPAIYPFRLMLPRAAGFMHNPLNVTNGSSADPVDIPVIGQPVPSGQPEWSVEGILDLPLVSDIKARAVIGMQLIR